jgi:hypothetical protein
MNFFEKYKRVFIIIGFLGFIILIAYFLYIYFFKSILQNPVAQPTIRATTTEQGGKLTGSDEGQAQVVIDETGQEKIITAGQEKPTEEADGGLTKTSTLTNSPTLSPSLSSNGTDVNFYNKSDGKFYRVDENGNISLLVDKTFHDVDKVTWSPAKNKAVLEYPDGSNIVYDFNTNKQVTLPKHWEQFDFSTDGEQLVMKSIGIDEENRWLAISNSDGSGSKPLEMIGKNADAVIPSWSPNNQVVAMYTEGIDLNRKEVYFVGLNKENFKSTIVEGRGFEPLWSKSGEQLAYSVYDLKDESKPELWVVNSQGDEIGSNRKRLNVQTWASKCTFYDAETMYCGVPRTLPEGSGIFPEMAKDTADDLYKINVKTGEKELIATTEDGYNMTNLMVSKDEKNLYFTDNRDSLIRKIKLQ